MTRNELAGMTISEIEAELAKNDFPLFEDIGESDSVLVGCHANSLDDIEAYLDHI